MPIRSSGPLKRHLRSGSKSLNSGEFKLNSFRMCLDLLKGIANACSVFSGMITILIKDKKQEEHPWPLHIERHRASSGFIARSLMANFFSGWDTTTLPKPIDLTNEDPSLIKHYVGWVNTRKIATSKRPRWVSQERRSEPDYKEEMTLDMEKLALCYGLGERLEDAKYRNALLCTVRYYVAKEGIFPSDRAVAIMYEHTSKDSPARKMMVDFWAHAGDLSWLESKSVRYSVCREFFEDLLPALLRARAKPESETWPWADNADAYLITDGETQTEETCVLEGGSMEM
ncbi:hypothetical protein P171DRAFT_27300 [Karstenula rhodostoma CBS 690.94]|uniref:BTB domain-containing protein n=1 Tax=Karstenula rhodostoma CBS 690.94 TaxID=1392251 RepID=A0A9P4UCC0_9PLEO|nr:hypothetical protein P171DRAFT_27300 [Karstenula rhodostoma CBS 690.94]